MSTLFLTRGLPASGKTTQARAWVNAAIATPRGEGSRIRLNRDDLRMMMFGGWTGLDEHEDAVTVAQHLAAATFLRTGGDVIADDTNLRPDVMAAWHDLAAGVGAEVQVWDLTDVPIEECLRRNGQRAGTAAYVPVDVIQRMWQRYIEPGMSIQ